MQSLAEISPSASPSRIPWPPILLGSTLVISFFLNYLLPYKLSWFTTILGAICSGLGIGLILWAITTMKRSPTNILPHRPADKLVTTGPFQFSRNPIYSGDVLILLGLSLALDSLWFFWAAICFAISTQILAIGPEERHLHQKFGKDWTTYALKTPRWLA